MLKKHLVLTGISFSVLLLFIASLNYPGGTPKDATTIAYSFTQNYISNLLDAKALNGMENKGRAWAIIGVLFSSLTFGIFFIQFSKRILLKSASIVIKYLGILLTVLAFFVVVPSLHDIVVTISFIITLIVFFYITILALKSKLIFLKTMSVLFLLFHYFVCYMYFTRSFMNLLPLMQKLIHLFQIVWLLYLVYFTQKKDFEHIVK